MKGDGGIDGSSGRLLCDILCDEGGERECLETNLPPFLPRKADSSFTMSGESSSSSSFSILGGHWMMSSLSRSAKLANVKGPCVGTCSFLPTLAFFL